MTPEKLHLKRATHETVRGVGGVEAAAGFCRIGKSALANTYAESDKHAECFMPLDVVLDLEPLARGRDGWPHVTRLLAASLGFALVKLPDALPTNGELLKLAARQAREGGSITHGICEALADDGRVDAREASGVRPQVRDAIEILVALDASLAAIIEAGE